ncbi:MAG: phenylalanine--tRNA ligase subunit alpha [Candidatus Gracilibacteria bacterium]|nr:phenylalanine--tRNA ligase subunit alpha [Candidatus Gracilibacteria bacterium]
MKVKLEELRATAITAIAAAKNDDELYEIERSFTGRKGQLTALLKGLKDLSNEDKRIVGPLANKIKDDLQIEVGKRSAELKKEAFDAMSGAFFDASLPGNRPVVGRLHPITKFIQEIEDTFLSLNFDIAEGPEVEDDYHNFTALNIPEDHPARDMQDTLWAKNIPYLLRTHTSPVQIRYMESHKPPIRVVCPGRVYRKDDVDATHSPMFHQFEGLMIDKTTNLAHLKGILTVALRRLIHPDLELRFRSSYFPFVEPGMEVDVTCVMCNGDGCHVCKRSGWIEMLGCGMVHPNVMKSVGLDPQEYQGFAFGAGIERLLMIKFQINDIRLFFENDPRFLEQFPQI